ncbi:hypothetical protein GIR22_02595 [Pseudomonas sp. CCM 7891]|uniref:Tetracyclin repressor SlmA-like C-terminal domain-containing protein n=1 Tax=Pseudomonas karstica TaxID=1055468 RepID=A0A7X2RND9_9PSED|nr:hypothetical protein [Pseudomonas karstica]
MYQYYPHKQALLYASLARHLQSVQDEIRQACLLLQGERAGTMADALAEAYLKVKTKRGDVTRALYLVVAELDTAELVDRSLRSMKADIAAMFASAKDAEFVDANVVTAMFLLALSGTVRAFIEDDTAIA